MLAEQEATQTMELVDMKHYIATKLHKTAEVKSQLAAHISACEAIVGSLGSDFEELQFTEKSILDCARRKECLDYIERNIGELPGLLRPFFPLHREKLLCIDFRRPSTSKSSIILHAVDNQRWCDGERDANHPEVSSPRSWLPSHASLSQTRDRWSLAS